MAKMERMSSAPSEEAEEACVYTATRRASADEAADEAEDEMAAAHAVLTHKT